MKYDDIINLPHHTSVKHPRMSRSARAAQFAPFAAITGLDDELEETARLTDAKRELEDEEKEKINNTLVRIKNNPQLQNTVKLTYFKSDGRKAGGAYITEKCSIRRIDETAKVIILTDRREIQINDIFSIDIYK